ncbi:DUF2314 domain-containing protein [Kumtagia ephedrae]|uniref:DUF2314 domain-containing protein n=1 Tax=Kumtagia ephedrae TaxID=2116701 RepID=A0A2P7S3I5_9HYPH|nr:DUF2314 domain-containing protein [Mesorhizobium ephedrae]PSJ57036.1 DUF2314 domain-containing protein [Mesorhizobium ephedrae]
MREPTFEIDGWSLEDGETYHAAAPETFWIPSRQKRESLQPGDLVKLIFRISVDDADESIAVERMWVLVRERIVGGYLGMLNNEPSAIAANEEFWLGTELPFSAKHVINIEEKDENTVALAREEPRRRWPKQ